LTARLDAPHSRDVLHPLSHRRSLTLGSLALASSLLGLSAAGCRANLGQADEDAAHEVVYDSAGTPAYAGQALVIQSCGSGGFCHSPGIAPEERFGAPAGLDFDLRIAATTVELEEEASQRLLEQHASVVAHAPEMWEQVSGLHMPPGGEAGAMYRASVSVQFERYDDEGVSLGPLPGLDTEEGREILRNWLAMGAELPVVERTQPRLRGAAPVVGDVVPSCEVTCVEPSFESIYAQILVPSCGASRCHDNIDSAEDLDLVGAPPSDASRADFLAFLTTLLDGFSGARAQGSVCRTEGWQLLVPGDPESSLLYAKVSAESSADVCGSKMPLAGNPLSEQRLCALREWIACGACGPEDRSCDACIATARATCGVGEFDPERGVAECLEVTPCANRPPSP
jgi:hypothetical protein